MSIRSTIVPSADGTPAPGSALPDDPGMQALRAALVARREELRQRIHAPGADWGSERDVSDQKDEAARSEALDVEGAQQTIELEELREVDAALERMALGTFGTCVSCGGPIPAQRLLANPSALRCAACQSAEEEDRRHSR